jgi:hypothetical protein
MKHTPGPWEYDAESEQVLAPKCGYQWAKGAPIICEVGRLDYNESGGNAKLIAAAPDLYEALKNARELLSWWQGERGDSIHAGVMELADAAIAKVEGV